MKKIKLFCAFAAVLAILLLSGCGRSDVTLYVLDDGSFRAQVTYAIDKSYMGNNEVLDQVKTLVTGSLDESGIEYEESETEQFVYISLSRDFANIAELTSEEAWKGIGMVPRFTDQCTEGTLWTRYEDGRLKIDGSLDVDSFNAGELISDVSGSSAEAFGGSVKVVLPMGDNNTPIKAESSNAPTSSDSPENADDSLTASDSWYVWSGTAADTVEISLSSEPLSWAESNVDSSSSEASGGSGGSKDKSSSNAGSTADKNGGARTMTVVGVPLLLIAAAVACAVVLIKKKKQKQEDSGK